MSEAIGLFFTPSEAIFSFPGNALDFALVCYSNLDDLDHHQDYRDDQVEAQREHANLACHRPDGLRQLCQWRHLPYLLLHMFQGNRLWIWPFADALR